MSSLNKKMLFFLKVFFYFSRLMGLAPFYYNKKTNKFHSHFLLDFYTVLLFLFNGIIVPIGAYNFMAILFANNDGQFINFIAIFVNTSIYISSVLICFWVLCHRKNILKLLNIGILLTIELNSYYSKNDYKKQVKYFRNCIVKALLIQTLGILTMTLNISFACDRITNADLIFGIVTGVSGIYPTWFASNTFFTSLSLSAYFYRIINDQIKILTLLAPAQIGCGKKHNCRHQQRLCDLSDNIDKIAILHNKVTNFTRNINKLLSIPILVIITNAFITVVCQSFFTYVVITTLVKMNQFAALLSTSASLLFDLYNFIEIFSLSYISSKVMTKAEKTSELLYMLPENEDARLEQSVEIFAISMLQNKLKISAGGLFQIDYTLIYSVVAGVTSYIIILVQFQLSK